jgi:hypothetical protein
LHVTLQLFFLNIYIFNNDIAKVKICLSNLIPNICPFCWLLGWMKTSQSRRFKFTEQKKKCNWNQNLKLHVYIRWFRCQIYNACALLPCHNGGNCSTTPPSHYKVCQCPVGYAGLSCETNIDDCVGVTCPEPTQCLDEVNGYRCSCPVGQYIYGCLKELVDLKYKLIHVGVNFLSFFSSSFNKIAQEKTFTPWVQD